MVKHINQTGGEQNISRNLPELPDWGRFMPVAHLTKSDCSFFSGKIENRKITQDVT